MASKTSRPKTETAEKGTTTTLINEFAEFISATNIWDQEEVTTDEETETRINEYFNLCVSKGEMPLFETLCLYLGVSDDVGKKWADGEGVSGKRRKLMQKALTRLKSIEAKAVFAGKIRDVPYIWRSKQYFGYREPDSKLTLDLPNPLKELPSAASIAAAYLEDYEEEEG